MKIIEQGKHTDAPAIFSALIFDLYGTLLQIESTPRPDSEWHQVFGVSRKEFHEGIQTEIQRRHALAKTKGIRHPEIQWPEVVATICPDVDPAFAARFERTPHAAPHALELLEWLNSQKIPLGIASNAQAYTLDELRECGISIDLFPIRFFSFEHGFSKPDPGVFKWLRNQFAPRRTSELLFIGDRLDNDILPARAQGFSTFHVTDAGLKPLLLWLKSIGQ